MALLQAGLVDSLTVVVVSALIGGLGLYVGGRVVAGTGNYGHAVVTALTGALVWGLAALLVGGIPLLGPILVLAAYLLVVEWRYRVGWIAAGGITLVAWLTVVAVFALLSYSGVSGAGFDAIGVPYTD